MIAFRAWIRSALALTLSPVSKTRGSLRTPVRVTSIRTTGDLKAQSLFDFTFTRQKTWTNPFHDDLTFSVPDQMEVIATTSSGSTSNIYRTSTEYASALSYGAGVSGGFGAIFSASVRDLHVVCVRIKRNTRCRPKLTERRRF
jgi:hypothetical protein